MSAIQPTRIVLLSTAADAAARGRLEAHLSSLIRTGLAEVWHEDKVPAGLAKAEEVDRHLAVADMILLLISADFVASNESYRRLDALIERDQIGKSRVFPILVRSTVTEGMPLSGLTWLPSGSQPISERTDADSAWREVVQHIRQQIMIRRSGQTDPANSEVSAAAGDCAPLLRLAEFDALIEERTRSFVGRVHITSTIDEMLADPQFPSGYVVIWGEPGIGKTALACRLVRDHGWIHHFNIGAQNIRSTGSFLANVCSQLIARYVPAAGRLPSETVSSSQVLNRLLCEVARIVRHPVVVVVDALDESDSTEIPPSANPLLLPTSLPDKIYFLVTSRGRPELHVDRRRDLHMKDSDPRNLSDITAFIEAGIAAHAEALQGWAAGPQVVLETLLAKSEGNFMYVTLVWRDLIERRLTPERLGALSELPQGLRAYYRRHWREMRSSQLDFDHCGKQVICLLASALEAITAEALADWATTLNIFQVKQVLYEWRHFLQEGSADGKTTYQLYHGSFRDFLREEIGLEHYSPQIADALWRKAGLH